MFSSAMTTPNMTCLWAPDSGTVANLCLKVVAALELSSDPDTVAASHLYAALELSSDPDTVAASHLQEALEPNPDSQINSAGCVIHHVALIKKFH
jgi:hypothetical protein